MPDESRQPDQQAAVTRALRGAVQNVVQAGSSPEAIRAALGLDEVTNVLHVQNTSAVIEINTVDAKAFFAKESGPTWVQYRDHRPHAEWEKVVLPEFDPELTVNLEFRLRGTDG